MKKRGFTLIELMIVVAIIGVLLAMIIPRVGLLIDRSRERSTGKNLKNIYTALVQYTEKDKGVFLWPALNNAPNTDLQMAMTDIAVNPQGAPFDETPNALLRRSAKDEMTPATDFSTQNNLFHSSSDRLWNGGADNSGGWTYITAGTYTGEIFINSSVLDTFKGPYSAYPCW